MGGFLLVKFEVTHCPQRARIPDSGWGETSEYNTGATTEQPAKPTGAQYFTTMDAHLYALILSSRYWQITLVLRTNHLRKWKS